MDLYRVGADEQCALDRAKQKRADAPAGSAVDGIDRSTQYTIVWKAPTTSPPC